MEINKSTRIASAHNQSRSSKALVYLALSVGATTPMLPDPVVANSLFNSVEQMNTQSFSGDQPKSRKTLDKVVNSSDFVPEKSENLVLNKKPKQTIHNSTLIDNQPKLTGLNLPSLLPRDLEKSNSVKNIPNQQVHVVKFGDTVNEIAAKYQVPPEELIKVNQIANPELIEVNQRLVIPQQNMTKSQKVLDKAPTPARNQYLTKLRADIMRLRQEYQAQGSDNPSVSLIDPDLPTTSENSEPSAAGLAKLKNDVIRLRKQYQQQPSVEINNEETDAVAPQTQAPVVMANLETDAVAPQTPPPVVMANMGTDAVPPSELPQSENNNVTFESDEEISLRRQGIPDLPPLLPAEEYLPESPELEIFNGYIWPAEGVFTSGFGWRWGRMHNGIDIAAPIGTPIYAAASGEVIYAGWHAYGFGNLVKVRHYDGSITLYAHNNRILVHRGQRVEQGEQISEMGSTGYSTGPHLHFEIHPHRKGPVNPLAYLPK